MKYVIVTFLLAVGLSAEVEAATFVSDSQFGALGCEESFTESIAVSTYCGRAIVGGLTAETRAAAGDGSVSAYASAWSHRDNDGFGTFFPHSRSFANIYDNITATWADSGEQFNGTASFGIDLLGALEADSGASATAYAGLQVDGKALYAFDSNSMAADSISQVNFVFNGTSRIFSFAFAEAYSCTIVASGTTCYSASDLGSSLRLTGLSFFDSAGADVTSKLNVTSESGFDYVTGASGHTRQPVPAPVPLPGAGLLMLIGLSSIGMMRLRR